MCFLVPDSSKFSYSGRLAYLEAIASLWRPSPLATLGRAAKTIRGVVLAEGIDPLDDSEHARYAIRLSWSSFTHKRSPVFSEVCTALAAWRKRYTISPDDSWIMDAALQTVAYAALQERQRPRIWVYRPSNYAYPKFIPNLRRSDWSGDELEPWLEFSKRMYAQFAEQLNQYRLDMRRFNPYPKIENTEEERDAKWLARYMGGESWDALAHLAKKYENPKSTVRNYSIRFAKRIGVTLPERPAGRRPRRNT